MTIHQTALNRVPVHPSGIHSRIVAKVVQRRGRLHAYERLVPEKTALVVIDMTDGLVGNDENCRTIVPAINTLAAALRSAGGTIAWVSPRAIDVPDKRLVPIVGAERAALFAQQSRLDDPGSRIHTGLTVAPEDLRAEKSGASAFFPGKCALPQMLRARSIDAVLIAGTVTNVCCESSGRDAVELGYAVTMVSDALAGHSFGLHEASLATFYRIFGDVRPVADLVQLLDEARVLNKA